MMYEQTINLQIISLEMQNKCELVRKTCEFVYNRAKHVSINEQNLKALADKYVHKIHVENQQTPERVLLQVFILDSMNFCFWPLELFEYDQLLSLTRKSVNEGIQLSDLAHFQEEDLIVRLFNGKPISQADQRARILREMSNTVFNNFQGSFTKIVLSAEKSAVSLLNILTQNFPNFQDHNIYQGHQIHFYKRAQILIKDIYRKFNGKGLGEFTDICELTMFPDYRVPQLLQAQRVFIYSAYLKEFIYSKTEITDRHLEAQLRACTVVAVQKIKKYLQLQGKKVQSFQIDWFLWRSGEQNLQKLPPHHRCLTIYY